VASKVDDDRIACLDGGVVDEMGHECIFNGAFCGLAIYEHADMAMGNMEIVHKPVLHFERIIDTRR
jgi:hypothetical protein